MGCKQAEAEARQQLISVLQFVSHVYVPVNSKTAHPPPPGANPRAFDFFDKFWSNSPLCCQLTRSNAPPVRASKRVKSPALQGKQNRLPLEINRIPYLWKPVLQNFQLVFAPRFKQRHISRYNYIKPQQQQKKTHLESTRAMTRERGSRAEAKNRPLSRGGHFESQGNKKLCFCPSSLALDERLDGQNLLFQHCVIKVYCEVLLFPTADRRFDRKVKCPTGRASFWVKFPRGGTSL